MVTAIVSGKQLVRMLRITDDAVEIDHRRRNALWRESTGSQTADQLRSAAQDGSSRNQHKA